MIKENTLTNGSIFMPPLPPTLSSSNKKRSRSQTIATPDSKKSRLTKTSDQILSSSTPIIPIINTTTTTTLSPHLLTSNDEYLFRKPLITNNNLPPITIEQLLGLRGDIPDVHKWSTNELIEFFLQQGYEYASIVLNKFHINGNKLYELTREQVFRMSTLKIGKALKLWNVIEQIQRKFLS